MFSVTAEKIEILRTIWYGGASYTRYVFPKEMDSDVKNSETIDRAFLFILDLQFKTKELDGLIFSIGTISLLIIVKIYGVVPNGNI